MKKILFILISLSGLGTVLAQDHKLNFSINLNHNLYLPRNSTNGTHYILRGVGKGVTVGGFGIGASLYKPMSARGSLKVSTHLSKWAYVSPDIDLRNDQNISQGTIALSTRDFQSSWMVLGQYRLVGGLSVGAGLGANLWLGASQKFPGEVVTDFGTRLKISNYKRVLPIVPLEVSYAFSRMLVNVRLEYGLLNRYKGEVSEYKKEYINVLYFELGYFLYKTKS